MVEGCTMHDKAGLREIFERFNVFLVMPETEEQTPDEQVIGRV